jgi:hypothetical protein
MAQQSKSPQGSESGRTAQAVGAATGGARLEERPQVELYELAQKLEIAGYSEMSRQELIEAIRRR